MFAATPNSRSAPVNSHMAINIHINIHRDNNAHNQLCFVDLSFVETAPNGLLALPLPPFSVACSVVVDVPSKETGSPMESS